MRLHIDRELTLEQAEQLIRQIAAPRPSDDQLDLDLSQCTHIDAGAGWRVANALRVAQEQYRIVVHIPARAQKLTGGWFQTLTTSGLGHALARRAECVRTTESDITEKFRYYYSVPQRPLSIDPGDLKEFLWASKNFVLINRIASASLNPNDVHVFGDQLLKTFPTVDLHPNVYGKISQDDPAPVLSPVVHLFYEAVQNCYDHCERKPLPSTADIISYLAIRYHDTMAITQAIPPKLPEYLRRTKEVIEGNPEEYSGAYLEVVVNDDGVGIPARLSLNPTIAEEPFEDERQLVLEALNTRASVKLRSLDCVIRGDTGYGFLAIGDSLRRLGAFAAIRTGRSFAYFDATEQASSESDRGSGLFHVLPTPLGNMPGTNLQVIFPHRLGQRPIPFSTLGSAPQ